MPEVLRDFLEPFDTSSTKTVTMSLEGGKKLEGVPQNQSHQVDTCICENDSIVGRIFHGK